MVEIPDTPTTTDGHIIPGHVCEIPVTPTKVMIPASPTKTGGQGSENNVRESNQLFKVVPKKGQVEALINERLGNRFN